jgi:hypothetical protein
MTLLRYDMPDTIKRFMITAVENGTLDLPEVYCLGAAHGRNWWALIEDVLESAFAGRHSEIGRDSHRQLVKLAEPYWGEMAAKSFEKKCKEREERKV